MEIQPRGEFKLPQASAETSLTANMNTQYSTSKMVTLTADTLMIKNRKIKNKRKICLNMLYL